MSYLVLARKWRPKSFDTMVAQAHVIGALKNALENQRLHHAYLFTGTRGVGKTTVARIFAKALNCEAGVSANPCGQCASCLSIDEGKFPDLIEVDAASRTGVDDTRELLDNVQYAPAMGRFKIYLIDEVHMFSKSSFNALLKTLEEPPAHVKFILATTDPQKLPITVLSRCLQFNLKRIDAQQMADHLAYVLTQEAIAFEPEATRLVAWAADGSLRDALSLLDQAIAYSGGEVSEAQVRAMLGLTSSANMLNLIEQLFTGEFAQVYAAVEQLTSMVSDVESLLADLIEQLHHIAMIQQLGAQAARGLPQTEDLARLAGLVTPQDLQVYYQIALKGRSELNLAPRPIQAFEMLMLRMVAFRPVEMSGIAVSAHAAQSGVKKKPSLVAPVQPSAQATLSPKAPPSAESSPGGSSLSISEPLLQGHPPVDEPKEPVKQDTQAMLAAMRSVLGHQAPAPQVMATSVSLSAPISVEKPEAQSIAPVLAYEQDFDAPIDASLVSPPWAVESPSEPDLPDVVQDEPSVEKPFDWADWIERSGLTGGALVLAKHAEFKGIEGQNIHLAVSSQQEGIDQSLWRDQLEQALARDLGAGMRLSIRWFEGESLQSPFALQAKDLAERKSQVIEALKNRADIQLLTEALGLKLNESSVRILAQN